MSDSRNVIALGNGRIYIPRLGANIMFDDGILAWAVGATVAAAIVVGFGLWKISGWIFS